MDGAQINDVKAIQKLGVQPSEVAKLVRPLISLFCLLGKIRLIYVFCLRLLSVPFFTHLTVLYFHVVYKLHVFKHVAPQSILSVTAQN